MSGVKTRKVGTITVTMRYRRRKGWILTSGVRRRGGKGKVGKKSQILEFFLLYLVPENCTALVPVPYCACDQDQRKRESHNV